MHPTHVQFVEGLLAGLLRTTDGCDCSLVNLSAHVLCEALEAEEMRAAGQEKKLVTQQVFETNAALVFFEVELTFVRGLTDIENLLEFGPRIKLKVNSPVRTSTHPFSVLFNE
jgi:hypothetical protein